jgi:hypothetical protein
MTIDNNNIPFVDYEDFINKTRQEVSDEELQGIYIYLDWFFEEMEKDEQLMWIELLEVLDPEFNKIDNE